MKKWEKLQKSKVDDALWIFVEALINWINIYYI